MCGGGGSGAGGGGGRSCLDLGCSWVEVERRRRRERAACFLFPPPPSSNHARTKLEAQTLKAAVYGGELKDAVYEFWRVLSRQKIYIRQCTRAS